MTPNIRPKKYLYKAHAVALRGSIRKPYHQELGDHLAIATYAGSGGRTECSNRNFAIGKDISYDFAYTEIVAEQVDDNVHQTTVTSQVKGLQIGGRLTVDEVTCRLHSVYDSRTYPGRCVPRILPAGSTIKNLQVDGKVQPLKLPDAFNADSKAQDAFFKGERDTDLSLHPGAIPKKIIIEGFGTIHYAEWVWIHPDERHQQHLTMLRLALGCDFGGDVDVSSGNSDGTGWPPTAN
jgi:hypothetical protein